MNKFFYNLFLNFRANYYTKSIQLIDFKIFVPSQVLKILTKSHCWLSVSESKLDHLKCSTPEKIYDSNPSERVKNIKNQLVFPLKIKRITCHTFVCKSTATSTATRAAAYRNDTAATAAGTTAAPVSGNAENNSSDRWQTDSSADTTDTATAASAAAEDSRKGAYERWWRTADIRGKFASSEGSETRDDHRSR